MAKELTPDEMRAALALRKSPRRAAKSKKDDGVRLTTLSDLMGTQLAGVGADEAPNLPIKAYIDPDRGKPMQLPTGGVRMPDGQLLQPGGAPQQAPQQAPGAPGMPAGIPPQALAALMASRGAAPGSGPAAQPPSNILAMTRQGQAMAAMRPPGPPAMAEGGEVQSEPKPFTHEVLDREGRVVSRYRSLETAHRGADRLDNAFGASVHRIRPIRAARAATT